MWASRRCGRARAGPLEVVAPAAADERTREYSEAAHQMRGREKGAMAKEKGATYFFRESHWDCSGGAVSLIKDTPRVALESHAVT